MRTLLSQAVFPEGDSRLLEVLRRELESQTSYTLWLQGEMGAGKTTFVRHYLYALGLPDNTPVVSPTYTIMNEYRIGSDWYAHLDLYRAEDGFSLDELGIHDVRTFKGQFVEWPEQAGASEMLEATHVLRIISDPDHPEYRTYTFEAYH